MQDVEYAYGASPNNWYGFGITGGTLIYNVPVNSKHSFQIDGVQEAYINSSGLTVTDTITCNNYLVQLMKPMWAETGLGCNVAFD